MADFDSFNYDIRSRLPEWWKEDTFLRPVNEYTQTLIADILQGLLTTMGVVQPLNCWLSIPEEYDWYHHYQSTESFLQNENEEGEITNNAVMSLFGGDKLHVQVPNTKRKCHAKIKLKLLGAEISNSSDNKKSSEIIDELIIQNADQKITIHDVSTISTIEIFTENNEILIDGASDTHLIDGQINKIKPTIKNSNYQVSYIDKDEYIPIKIIENDFSPNLIEQDFYLKKVETEELLQLFTIDEENRNEEYLYIKISGKTNDLEENKLYNCIFCKKNEEEYGTGIIEIPELTENNIVRYKNIDLEDENKKTEIIITQNSVKKIMFDLEIYLQKPTYTTEQNIRVASVSAFPIEWIRLYGYFCHPFNNHSGYKFLWEKRYSEESRTVFDRITKQYDCERFCIKVKFYGIDSPLVKGFPQETDSTNMAFQPNPNLDKWGKIYNMPRRFYKTDITEDEEPFTFPKYYRYPIEQDYWYEERMVNEYRFDEDSINSVFVKDSDFQNIGTLQCIYPFMNDIWVYTETIDPEVDNLHLIRNDERKHIPLCSLQEKDDYLGVEWEKLQERPLIISLNPKSEEILKQNNFSYQSKILKCSFCLSEFRDTTPENIEIKGIELKLKTRTNVQSKTIRLSENSKIIIPYPKPSSNNTEYILEKINIFNDNETWLKEKGYYIIGGEDNLFSQDKITRAQLFEGNDGKIDFELGFVNENPFLKSDLYIEDMILNIYYEVISNEYSVNVEFDTQEIDLRKDSHEIKMKINIKNTGKIKVDNKELYIIIPPELNIKDGYKSYLFNLDIDEVCDPIEVTIEPNTFEDGIRTGWYDILVVCEDKVISNEILVRGKEL